MPYSEATMFSKIVFTITIGMLIISSAVLIQQSSASGLCTFVLLHTSARCCLCQKKTCHLSTEIHLTARLPPLEKSLFQAFECQKNVTVRLALLQQVDRSEYIRNTSLLTVCRNSDTACKGTTPFPLCNFLSHSPGSRLFSSVTVGSLAE